MLILRSKKNPAWHLLLLPALFPTSSFAEGIVIINPYISTSLNYDDNVFRFSSPEQAKATLGSSKMSDNVAQFELGAEVNLRLSRQLVSLKSSVNENKYSHFSNLDNTGSANSLRWDWYIGSNLYGELGASKTKAIAGFNETRNAIKNITTSDQLSASMNWDFHPDWTLYLNGVSNNFKNDAISSAQLDREDNVLESGFRYHSPLGTQLGLSYRLADANFPNRYGLIKTLFGADSSQEEVALTAAWLPAPKTKISTRLSHVNLVRKNSQLPDFNGFSQRWGLDYSATSKINLNLAAYRYLSPIDDVVSTYVEATGMEINPTWAITSKLALRGNLAYSENAYIGSAAISNNNTERLDTSTQAGVSLIYTPTLKSLLQLQYSGEKRSSNIKNAGYQFNNISVLFRYGF
jgi:exopolysaccharide biosynthesis operon protein EpsL